MPIGGQAGQNRWLGGSVLTETTGRAGGCPERRWWGACRNWKDVCREGEGVNIIFTWADVAELPPS